MAERMPERAPEPADAPPDAAAEPPTSPDFERFVAAIAEARTLEDLQGVARQAAAEVAGGRLFPAVAGCIHKLIGEQRQILRARRETERGDGPGHVAVCTEQGLALVKVFEEIVDGRERSRLVEEVRAARDRDAERFPRALLERPEEMRERLAAAGLDAFGEAGA